MSGRSRQRRALALWLVASAFALFVACRKPAAKTRVRASFGVFYGGQVQEREELPLVLDRARQLIGIRIEFDEAPRASEEVRWELEKPGGGKDAGPAVVDYGKVRTRPGEPTLDIPLAFRPGDRTGSWRVKAMLGEQTLLDRGFRVVAPTAPAAPEE